ncbi:MAG: B12-binding domain-containing radical SAM protein [Candidatus Lokiarchaeota archaeon]|nr:B12-binding domain-containing radical SAM protein [Candidatus Lokiarchaeota archaeon]
MNSILIYPQLEFGKVQVPTPPYSILFIADYLLKRNVDVKIFDLRFDKLSQVFDAISNTDPEFIGISVMTGPQIQYALKICESIKKEFKNIKIVWGGVHATILPTQTLQNKFVDFVVRGEGEKVYYELVSGKNVSQIKSLSFKKGNKIFHNPNANILTNSEINELKIPWNLINHKHYIRNGNLNLITSRGCPFKCAFCYNTLFNSVWRGWTAEKCIQELDKCLDLGAKKITFYDDYFFANSKRIKDLFVFFKEQDIRWKAELRVNRLDYSLAKEAKNHGCIQMYFGAESGSQRVLNILNKNISIKEIIQSAKITKDVGLSADYSWMIGIPSETKTDIKKTITLIKIIKKINPESEFSIKILFPYPKTEIHDLAKQYGFKPPSNLLDWAEIRRDQASNYLKNKSQLEMISITSAIIGRKVFEQETIPIFKLIRFLADFRWNHEFFSFGFENFYFKIFRNLIDNVMSRRNSVEYDPFTHEFVSVK